MLKRIPLFLFAVLMLGASLVPAASAQDQSKEIRTMLESRDREIKALLGNKKTLSTADKAKLKDMINGVIDFEAMSRQALGPHWTPLTTAQKKAFVDVFSEIVRGQSLANLDIYRTKTTYGKIAVTGDSARAMTSVIYKDVPAKVEYVLARNDGEWFVTDIILDEVSTAGGYERSFQSVVRKRGFDALMTSLNKKRASMEAKS